MLHTFLSSFLMPLFSPRYLLPFQLLTTPSYAESHFYSSFIIVVLFTYFI